MSREYPTRIPRERAVAALDLANALLDYQDLEPHDAPDHDVEVVADTWARWLELARAAAAEQP